MAVSRPEVTLSVVIMAHPKREAMVAQLIQKLDCPEPLVVWDRWGDRWDTGRRAMLAYDIDCTHHLVIQDDVVVCRDLVAGFARAIAAADEGVPISGYIGRLRPAQDRVRTAVGAARSGGASFITTDCLYWGPAIAVPTDRILEMVGHCDPLRSIQNYDRRMSCYWESRGIRTWSTWPSLVDHADGLSLVAGRIKTNHKTHSRVAHQFLGESRSALDLDWRGPVVHAQYPPTITRSPTRKTRAPYYRHPAEVEVHR